MPSVEIVESRLDNRTRFAAVACAVSLLICFLQGWAKSRGGMDLPWYVYPARLWLHGVNPYDTAVARAQFPAAWGGSDIQYSCALPPQAFLQMAPFAALPWSITLKAWWCVSFGSLLLSLWLMLRLFGKNWSRASQFWFVAILAQSKVIQSVAYRGQLSLFCLAFALLALYLASQKRQVGAGLALAVVCAKFILAPPVVLYWLWKREWKALGWFLGFTALLNVIALMRMDIGAVARTALPSFHAFSVYERTLHGGSSHVLNWAEIYDWMFGHGSASASLAGLVTLALAGLGIRAVCGKWREDTEGWVLASIVMVSLAAAYHRVYDGVFVFIVAACVWNAFQSASRRRPAVLYVIAAANALFLFGFSTQNLATGIEVWSKSHEAARMFAPVNAWLCLSILALTAWAGTALRADRTVLHISEEEAQARVA